MRRIVIWDIAKPFKKLEEYKSQGYKILEERYSKNYQCWFIKIER